MNRRDRERAGFMSGSFLFSGLKFMIGMELPKSLDRVIRIYCFIYEKNDQKFLIENEVIEGFLVLITKNNNNRVA